MNRHLTSPTYWGRKNNNIKDVLFRGKAKPEVGTDRVDRRLQMDDQQDDQTPTWEVSFLN